MRRRQFLTLLGGAAATWPMAARGQQAGMPVVGFIGPGSGGDNPDSMDGLRRGLAEAGYVEGRNVAIEYRWANGQYDRLPELAADLVGRRVAVIAAGGSSAPGLAAKAATTTIPIVFQTGGDPVVDGLVASMNRPGGNITGVSRNNVALDPKRLELLREAVPKATVAGFLVNAGSPRADFQIKQVQEAARSLGLRTEIAKVDTENALDGAFATLVRQRVDTLLVANDPAMTPWTERIVALTIRHALPAMFSTRFYVEAGGLMSYDSSLGDSFRQAGVYVGRILKGEKPADLPILEPTAFEFVLNLKTAKALGLEIPLKMHAFATEVIE
jgi:putative ABC transport system substrate-binding protein